MGFPQFSIVTLWTVFRFSMGWWSVDGGATIVYSIFFCFLCFFVCCSDGWKVGFADAVPGRISWRFKVRIIWLWEVLLICGLMWLTLLRWCLLMLRFVGSLLLLLILFFVWFGGLIFSFIFWVLIAFYESRVLGCMPLFLFQPDFYFFIIIIN
jgi:hypothetical protein